MRHALDLYELLPALYRLRDAERGEPLKALLELVAEQVDILKLTTDGQWDDLFIETCDRWVIPYIGDLVANNLLHGGRSRSARGDGGRSPIEDPAELFPDLAGPDLLPDAVVPVRADVAKTISYRRRKGTPPMLEELARDVTGWGAHAVEFFEHLEWTQHLNHLRPACHECPDLRRVERIERVDGPFDAASHTADVRRITHREGWHNLPNVGFFLWRLRSYPLSKVEPRQAGQPWRLHFSPLGNPAPLFTRWRRKGDEAGLATELHVPGPIRPAFFYEDLRGSQELYGLSDDDGSFVVFHDGSPVGADKIVCRRLATWPAKRPAGKEVAVDVERGRMVLGDGWAKPESVEVSYHYGFSGEVGGGPYPRRKWLLRSGGAEVELRVQKDGVPPVHQSLKSAISAWQAKPQRDTVIRILDSRTYALPASVTLSGGHGLIIEAADGQRPLLRTAVVGGVDQGLVIDAKVTQATEAALTLSGVAVEGFLHVKGDLNRLRLLHSTLVPGRHLSPETGKPLSSEASLVADGTAAGKRINSHLRLEIAASVTGSLRLPEHAAGLWLLDSIVDGTRAGGARGTAIAATGTSDQPGPPATLERVTVLGPSYFKRLALASEVIFTGPVKVTRRQSGCVRFSFVPAGSVTPRRYRCQGDLAVEREVARQEEASGATLSETERQKVAAAIVSWLVPAFTAVYYGFPGYAQLGLGCPREISTGAEDGSEMGAFSSLGQPQRQTNLRIRLDEYLPFGLEPGLIYVT